MGFFGDIWSGIKTVATAPYKLVTSVGSAAFDGIKAIGHFGGKVANTVFITLFGNAIAVFAAFVLVTVLVVLPTLVTVRGPFSMAVREF